MQGNSVASLAVLAFICHVTSGNSLKQLMQDQYRNLGARSLPSKREATNAKQQDSEMCFTIPHLQALKEQFSNYIDLNHDEKATLDEVYQYLRKYNPNVSERKVKEFMARRDKDGDGSVDFIPDYLMEVSSPDYSQQTAREWFTLEDSDGDGYVSRDELIKIAMAVGMPRKEAEATVVGYYMSADQDGDQRLSWEEYLPLYSA